MMQIKSKRGDFSICEEQRLHSALGQVILDGHVIAEISIVNQCHIDALSERVRSARVCDSTSSWIAMVTDPDVGGKVVQAVVLDDVLSIADDFQDEHVSSMTQHERISAPILCIKFDIQLVGIAVHILGVDGFLIGKITWIEFGFVKHGRNPCFCRADPIASHRRRAYFQRGQTLPIIKNGHVKGMKDIKNRIDVLRFNFFSVSIIHPSDGDEIGVLEYLLRGVELCRVESNHGDSTALTIASISHLLKGFEQMSTGNRHFTGQPDHTATALGRIGFVHLDFWQ